jgi:glycosyltransferase involved in cell wall biosynthesis
MSTEKKKVLVMADWFAPGFKAGGPIRSCVNFAQQLKDELDIYVLTSDRDLNDDSPYPGIQQNKWVTYNGGIKVFYASPSWLSFSNIKKEMKSLQPSMVYLNSMYSRFFSFYPLLLKRMGSIHSRFILSPRGMLKGSAVQFGKAKKKVFLKLFRFFGLHKNILFHCADPIEVQDVKRYFGEVTTVLLSNLPAFQKPLVLPGGKSKNHLRILFVGRIHPIKNLDFLLKALQPIGTPVDLTIIATVEDRDYWKKCEALISQLPGNIKINFKGEIPNEEIEKIICTQDIFALPTQGENFGHAIFESLIAGRPVVISDQTPWQGLAQWKAGWDISLSNPSKFTDVMRQFSGMNQEEINEWCMGAWQFAKNYIERSDLKKRYLEVFR